MIRQAPNGQGVHVVTTQAALYQLDRQAITTGSTKGPVENPGDELIAKSFADPIEIDDNRAVMLNSVNGKSMIVYDVGREREKLRAVTMSLSSGLPSGGGLAVNDGILVPLDNGRVEWIDFRTAHRKQPRFNPKWIQRSRSTGPIPLQPPMTHRKSYWRTTARRSIDCVSPNRFVNSHQRTFPMCHWDGRSASPEPG